MSDHLLLYDRDCGLCRTVTAVVLVLDRSGRLRPLALQSAEAQRVLPAMSAHERLASFHLVEEATGSVDSAGAALAELAELLPGGRVSGGALRAAPEASELLYRLVADNRHRIGRWIPSPIKARATRRVDRAEAAS
jgi:predicted DCC family thiol-disulfide oxidoreductase YuxK